jgi:hypothetical protein
MMRAFLCPICSVALAVTATSSLAQSNLSPIDNGFFRPVAALGLTPPPGESAPLKPAQSVQVPQGPFTTYVPPPPAPTPEAAELARREQERRAMQQRREEQQMIEIERQKELTRANSHPANPPMAKPAS